ncbi:MAG: SoxR reducing system RseC family protein [Bacteroidales bacterium]
MESAIEHCGIIERVEGDKVFVRIMQQSACSGCHAQSMCMAANKKDRLVEVADHSGLFTANETVMLCGQSGMGLRAVVLAFLIPLAIVVTAIVVFSLFWKESGSALAGLLLLVPYYAVLYFLRNNLKKQFTFTIKKLTP